MVSASRRCNAEKTRIEAVRIFDKAAPFAMAGGRVVALGAVKTGDRPALLGNLADAVAALLQVTPKIGKIRRFRIQTSHAYDGNCVTGLFRISRR